jgi:hypothetical protein
MKSRFQKLVQYCRHSLRKRPISHTDMWIDAKYMAAPRQLPHISSYVQGLYTNFKILQYHRETHVTSEETYQWELIILNAMDQTCYKNIYMASPWYILIINLFLVFI